MATRPELETARLTLRRFEFDDAPFVVELLNQPSFIQNIGDRGVRNVADAQRYLREGPMAMYDRYGFGLWRASRRSDGVFVGMCGLLKRDTLPGPDIGFAFLERHWGKGYAQEAARAVMDDARERLGIRRILGVTAPHNLASGRVLEKVGLRFVDVREVGGKESRFYEWP